MEEIKKSHSPIDVELIIKKLWAHRKQYYYVLPATLIITYLFMLFIPRYYKCTVSLAPENKGTSISGTLGSLASSFGLSGGLGNLKSEDAIISNIYPDVIKSKQFIAELMTTNVKSKDGDIQCNYYTYLRDKQKKPWWIKLGKTIYEWIVPTPKDNYNGNKKINVFNLTKLQNEIFKKVIDNINCNVDKRTNIVTITVEDQDPLVCATMADATCKKLQEFITNYRTNKTRIDFEYYKKLCEKSKAEYDKALDKYAASADAHTKTVLAIYQSKVERLENDMQAKYNIYTAMNTQMQAAAAKLQESTPAFTVIESASVPIKPAGPKRMIISIIVMILAFFIVSCIILKREKL